MAINQAKFLQPIRSAAIYSSYEAALVALETMKANLTDVNAADGISVVVRYEVGDEPNKIVKSLFGIFHTESNSFTTYSFDDKSMNELYTTIDELGDEIDALGNSGTSGVIDTKIEAAINDLTTSVTSTNGTLVNVTVGQSEGLLSVANVDESALTNKFTAVDKSISDLEKAIGEGGSVDAQITSAIEALDATVSGGSVVEGKHVAVEVVEVDGKITTVNVNEADIASAAALTGVDGRLKTAEDAITTLNGDANINGSVKAQIKAAEDALQAKIDEVSAEAKSYEMKEVTGTALTELGENVREAYQLFETVGSGTPAPIGDAIKIYKDSSLKSVSFADQTLTFTYILNTGNEDVVDIDVSSFLDENEFIDGLQVVDHKVSVKVDSTSEDFLTVSTNGVKLSGVQTAINDTIAAEIVKLDANVTNQSPKYVTVNVVEADGVITQVNVTEDALTTKFTEVENSISAETAARVAADEKLATDINDAKSELAGQIESVSGNLSSVSGSYLTNITVNGVEGSVANNMATVTVDGGDVALSTDYVSANYETVEGKTFTAAKAGDSIDTAIKAVDTNVATLLGAVLENEETTAAAITAINDAAGLSKNAGYPVNTSANYISGATNLVDADNKLDAAIKANAEAIEATKDAAISVVAGNGIEITGEGTEKTIAVKADPSVFTVEGGTLTFVENANIDCGTF